MSAIADGAPIRGPRRPNGASVTLGLGWILGDRG
jgi:hypothetical protein